MTTTLERKRAAAPCKNARQSSSAARDRFLGCFLGGAVGDALGAPVEFMGLDEIRRAFGRQGIRDFAPAYGRLGAITDDTQMTLFTAEGLIRGWLRGQTKGIASYPSVVAHAYLRWLLTQGREPKCELAPGGDGWLFGHRELHHSRAPGLTCLGALEEMLGFGDRARNNSKGCGGVMRVAPVGLFAWHWRHGETPHEDAFNLACELAALTHGHPTGQLAAGAFAVMVLSLACGGSLQDAVDVAVGCLKKRPKHQETLHALGRARALAESKLPVTDAIADLGGGWIAEEALAIAVYCALVTETFEEGVVHAVNHSGDCDSTGAIAGNLLGAMHGVEAIPERWLGRLELREVISEVGNDLFCFTDWACDLGEGGAHAKSIFGKYPPV
jgi:ADP-ribosylglycohydrolase